MKNTMIFIVLLFFIFTACSSATEKESENKGEKESARISTVKEPSNDKDSIEKKDTSPFYKLILSKNTANRTLMIFIDPHGGGGFIADKIRSISEPLNSNIICLNNVENNIPNYIGLINKDIDEFKKRTSISPEEIYIIGFSGGARMAYQYASINHVSGVVMCGAGLGGTIQNYQGIPVVLISGNGDFNFIEQYYSPFSIVAKNKSVLGLTFTGKHEWPNKDLLLFAINYLRNDKQIFNYNELMQDFVELRKNQDYYAAFKKIEAINKIFGTKQTQTDFERYISSKSFNIYIQKFEKLLQIELERNKILVNNLFIQNWDWWNIKINEIERTIKTTKDPLKKASFQRTRAYLGVVIYSVTRREMENPNRAKIEKYFNIYHKLDPENIELKKFQSQYANRSNKL